jgi:hypothetical protein
VQASRDVLGLALEQDLLHELGDPADQSAEELVGYLGQTGLLGPGADLAAGHRLRLNLTTSDLPALLPNLDGFDAASGQVLVKRALSVDAGAPIVNNTSSGVAIAEHALFVAAGGAGYASSTGYLIAYRAPGS